MKKLTLRLNGIEIATSVWARAELSHKKATL
jgi:hypothetical protein